MSDIQVRQKTLVDDSECEALQSYFSRCYEEGTVEPFLGVRLPDGRIIAVDCKIRVLTNG